MITSCCGQLLSLLKGLKVRVIPPLATQSLPSSTRFIQGLSGPLPTWEVCCCLRIVHPHSHHKLHVVMCAIPREPSSLRHLYTHIQATGERCLIGSRPESGRQRVGWTEVLTRPRDMSRLPTSHPPCPSGAPALLPRASQDTRSPRLCHNRTQEGAPVLTCIHFPPPLSNVFLFTYLELLSFNTPL